MAKGCLLGLIAMAISFLLILVPVQGVFNYMGWPVFNGAGMHAGAWVFPLPFVSGIVYYFLIRIEQRWRNPSKHTDGK